MVCQVTGPIQRLIQDPGFAVVGGGADPVVGGRLFGKNTCQNDINGSGLRWGWGLGVQCPEKANPNPIDFLCRSHLVNLSP